MSEFSDPTVQRRWEDWQMRLERALAAVPSTDRADLRMEIRGHVLDTFAVTPGVDEDSRLRGALARVGDPSQFLQMSGDGRVVFDAARFLAATGRATRTTARWSVRALAAAFALALAATGMLKLFMPDHVGLFRQPNGQIEFGVVADPAGQELLGLATIPLALFAAGALLWLLVRLLRSAQQE